MCGRQLQRTWVLLLGIPALLVGSPTVGLPQEPTSVAVGSRVRVKAEGDDQRWIVGDLLKPLDDSVRIRQKNSAYAVVLATSSLAHFERSLGRRRQTGRGALMGLGLILGAASDGGECSDFCEVDPGLSTGGSMLIGALAGGLFGTGVGVLV